METLTCGICASLHNKTMKSDQKVPVHGPSDNIAELMLNTHFRTSSSNTKILYHKQTTFQMTSMIQTSHANTTSGVNLYSALIIKYELFSY